MAVITVSWEYGSGGEDITRQVAKRVGYGYFGKEILADVARTANTTEDKIRPYDERAEHGFGSFLKKLIVPDLSLLAALPYYYPPSLPMERALYPNTAVSTLESQSALDAKEVLTFTQHVVEKLWERGNVVIVGRGSQKILAAKPGTFHVHVIGATGDRSKQIMAEEGISYAEARKKVGIIDRQRADYLKHNYDADWCDADFWKSL
ncbi:MAG: cytidylate kinase-like family protein [Candidatus Poribacteria bacterium]|nr:cytidylate kinase-like family protein [Candidatus Poribacteria bacterium]